MSIPELQRMAQSWHPWLPHKVEIIDVAQLHGDQDLVLCIRGFIGDRISCRREWRHRSTRMRRSIRKRLGRV